SPQDGSEKSAVGTMRLILAMTADRLPSGFGLKSDGTSSIDSNSSGTFTANMSQLISQCRRDLEPFQHRFLCGARRLCIADHVHLAGPAGEFVLQLGHAMVAQRGDQGVDLLEDHRLAAGGVLEIDAAAVDAVEPRIGDDLDPELVQLPDPMVADILMDALARHVAVDAQAHAAALARQHLRDP